MAAMKPRTGDGPLEVTKEGRGIGMRVPLEGGGRAAEPDRLGRDGLAARPAHRVAAVTPIRPGAPRR